MSLKSPFHFSPTQPNGAMYQAETKQGRARGYGRITRQNLVFQLPFWGQHFKPQIKKDG